ncbi:MAG: HAMP domain-containing protein [Deltaproteobacteria bacterium]|nr:HAMP domain-containing protein [Deltaproteobacteria bacterium]
MTFSLRYKLILSVVVIEVVMLTIMVVNNVRINTRTIQERMLARTRQTVALFATTTTNALLTMDLGSLEEYADQVKQGEDVVYACVVSPDGIILAHSDKDKVGERGDGFVADESFLDVKDGVYDVSTPVIVAEHLIGRVWIGFSPESAMAAIAKVRNEGIGIAMDEVGISVVAALLLGIVLTNSLKRLVNATKTLTEGDFSHRVDIKSKDEVGELGVVFNEMAQGLSDRTRETEDAYKKLKETQEELIQSEKMASLGRFVAGIAHEIDNPLDGIENCIRSILKEPDNKKQTVEYLNLILEGFTRIEEVIKQLKGYSTGYPIHRKGLVVKELLEDTITATRDLLEVSRVEVKRDYNGLGDEVISGDELYLRQVFTNIIMNAIDAMPGGGRLEVGMGRDEDGLLQISFKDTGIGISEENLKKVFDPFFTTKEVGKGTGLGLPVSLAIIERHGGKMEVLSQEGDGTTVVVSLPPASLKG